MEDKYYCGTAYIENLLYTRSPLIKAMVSIAGEDGEDVLALAALVIFTVIQVIVWKKCKRKLSKAVPLLLLIASIPGMFWLQSMNVLLSGDVLVLGGMAFFGILGVAIGTVIGTLWKDHASFLEEGKSEEKDP